MMLLPEALCAEVFMLLSKSILKTVEWPSCSRYHPSDLEQDMHI